MSAGVLCPGSFDPITNGHVDIILRARDLFGSVLVAVGTNAQKNYLFGDRRIDLVRETFDGEAGIDVTQMDGLLVDFCRDRGIRSVVKGLRFGADFDFELQMAHMNMDLGSIETVLLPASREHLTLSSTILRQIMTLGGDFSAYVPEPVERAFRQLRSD